MNFIVKHVGLVPDYNIRVTQTDVPGPASFAPLDKYEVSFTLKASFVANRVQKDRMEQEAIKGIKHDLYAGVSSHVYEALRANKDPDVHLILSNLLKEIEA